MIEPVPTFSGTMMPTPPVGTAAGMIVGTIGYMAPEQVRGLTVDHRADIFAFGAIVYELLTGERAFAGDAPADAISAILKDDPPQLANGATLATPALQRILQRCLEKKPEQRFHSAHDLAFALRAPSGIGVIEQIAIPPRARSRLSLSVATVVVAVTIGAVAAYGSWRRRERGVPPLAPVRFSISLPPGTNSVGAVAISPSGRLVVFEAGLSGAGRSHRGGRSASSR